jgi:hypothetical protein
VRQLLHGSLLALALLSACVRAGFGISERDGSTSQDTRPDPVGEDGLVDVDGATKDISTLGPLLSCGSPALVGQGQPQGLDEVALRTDGLELVAQQSSFAYTVRRTTRDAPFGTWQRAASWDSPRADLTFFADANGTEVYLAADKAQTFTPRRLWFCDLTNGCTLITVHDNNGGTMTEDMDGPSLRTLTSGRIIGVHNVDLANGSPPQLHAIYPETGVLADTWISTPLTVLNNAGGGDDPALAPDGLLIVFDRDGQIWAAERQSVDDVFGTPHSLPGLGASATVVHNSVEVGQVSGSGSPGSYELFFSQAEDAGPEQIVRAVCQR